jgi:hypothetical protein
MFDWSFAAFVVGLVVLIFLLTLLLSAVSYQPPESNRNTGESDTAQQQARDADYQQFAATIADAIHTYRRDRRADERYRAHRERATIVVLGVTSIFAFFAAGAAIYSAVIFGSQLGEMHRATVDSGELVSSARDTEEKQLRAYVSVRPVGTISNFAPNGKPTKVIIISNDGQTPAYNLHHKDHNAAGTAQCQRMG